VANVLTTNPISLDTPGSGLIVNDLQILTIYWTSGASGAIGDECKISDGAGNVIWDAVLDTAKQDRQTQFPTSSGLTVGGLSLNTLTHGVVRLYLTGELPSH